jgi:hypothetical protein
MFRCVGLGSRITSADLARIGLRPARGWQRRKAWSAKAMSESSCLLFHGPVWHGHVGYFYAGQEFPFDPNRWHPASCKLTCPSYTKECTRHCGTIEASRNCFAHPLRIESFIQEAKRVGLQVNPQVWDVDGSEFDSADHSSICREDDKLCR